MFGTITTAVAGFAVAVLSLRRARQCWFGEFRAEVLAVERSVAPGNNLFGRISLASVSASISVASGASCLALITIATSIGHNGVGITIGVLGALALIATLLFAVLTASINVSGRPQKLVPPRLRKET